MDPRTRDRLIPEEKRRREGAFYTPKPFVDLAHKYIADVFGENWREEYIVYDPAAGTGNLTRDYRFKELYISTIDQSDIDTMNQMGYNPNAVKFQFDFLNDPDEKMPAELLAALRGERDKQVIVLMNPPYGTAGSVNKRSGHKAGISNTAVCSLMQEKKAWGRARQQLFSQFFYRLWKYPGAVHLAAFTKPTWLTGPSSKGLRKDLMTSYRYREGFLLQGSEFADVSSEWGISLTIKEKATYPQKDSGKYRVDLVGKDLHGSTLLGSHYLYNTDGTVSGAAWVREEVKGIKTLDVPQLGSSLTVKDSGRGRLVEGALGYFYSNNNKVEKNATEVAFLSSAFSSANGLSVVPENFLKCTALFTARKSIKGNWINDKDEYLAPNEDHPLYQQFVADSVIYSLFNNSSEQSSLRNVEYKGKLHNIYNEFFWTLPTMMQQEADKHGFDALYQDARYGERRYVEKLLSDGDLFMDTSPLASDVYYAAEKLFIYQCMPYRQLLHEEHPEYHLNAWDAGYSQLKRVAQKFLPEEFKEFRKLYLEFEEYLRPQVYELGFLLGDGSEVDLLKWK